MSQEITCKKCGHQWTSRIPNPVKCPVCGYPTGLRIPTQIREGIDLPPSLPTIPPPSEIAQRIDFTPRLYLPSHRFATLSDKEWERLEEEAMVDYKNWLREMRVVHKERQRQHIVELAGRIIDRKRPVRRMWTVEPISTLIGKVQGIGRRNVAERKREEVVDTLKSLESWNFETVLENWVKETATARQVHPESVPKEEDFVKELEEDRKIIELAIPIYREIISVYDIRIEEIKKAEVESASLVKQANEIRNKALKPIEEENSLIDKMCEADSFGREIEVDKLLKSYRPLSSKINSLEADHREICGRINQLRIDPSDLLSFPPRKTLKLKFHDRIIKKL